MGAYLGVDLAWGEGTPSRAPNETGLVHLAADGRVLDAGWARGVDEVAGWLVERMSPGDVVAIDAPLVVTNETGIRDAEREVGQRYGRWKVAANPTNLGTPWLAGVALRRRLEASVASFAVVSGLETPEPDRISAFECYPYATLVGAAELGYDLERPRYKRPNPALPTGERRAFRARECDDLIERMSRLADADPPLDLRSHPVTASLVEEPSPQADREYKHREDLLDAAICAWTAALWSRHGLSRCQVLGSGADRDADGRPSTIVAPARPEQRR
ncbi:DUF429 domain-containing protein [Agromyces arachidis]|uniref:DUF429 domain-containing protein n=1 Tax=Agromyces arachidis TaxID=766966 RepID=UPI004057B581